MDGEKVIKEYKSEKAVVRIFAQQPPERDTLIQACTKFMTAIKFHDRVGALDEKGA